MKSLQSGGRFDPVPVHSNGDRSMLDAIRRNPADLPFERNRSNVRTDNYGGRHKEKTADAAAFSFPFPDIH